MIEPLVIDLRVERLGLIHKLKLIPLHDADYNNNYDKI